MNETYELIIAILVVVLLSFIFGAIGSEDIRTVMYRTIAEGGTEYEVAKSRSYAKGVNDALDAMALLGLEQSMYETNRTWGAMGDIVRQRLRVVSTTRRQAE